MKKKIAILGSTGSIGRQTLEVVKAFPDDFEVLGLAAGNNLTVLEEQIRQFNPKLVCVTKLEDADRLSGQLGSLVSQKNISIVFGDSGLEVVATQKDVDLVVLAIPGSKLLKSALAAIQSGKDLALASKEILVAGGELVMTESKKMGVKVWPIDSEHCALAQCLNGENSDSIKKVVLTASGGPFRETPIEKIEHVTIEEALKHPTWKMGNKITIDSATLMNKGFEVIEAHHLFGLSYSQIDVLVHPESIVHAMAEFADGSVMAQMAVPDMRIPIQYALWGGLRKKATWNSLSWKKISQLHFSEVDKNRYPCLELARVAGKTGGTAPAVLNAANEQAVSLFLAGKIGFTEIYHVVNRVLERHDVVSKPKLDQILEADVWARDEVNKIKSVPV